MFTLAKKEENSLVQGMPLVKYNSLKSNQIIRSLADVAVN